MVKTIGQRGHSCYAIRMSKGTILSNEYLPFAHSLADAAGEIIRANFRKDFTTELKQDQSPVTRIDQEVEKALRKMIHATFPEHGIVGEEYDSVGQEKEWVWVLDPIDGTLSFIAGAPVFGTLVSLCHKGVPMLGIIDQPITRERWNATSETTTQCNGKPAKSRSGISLSQAMFATTSPYLFSAEEKKISDTVMKEARYRNLGKDCYAYGLLASGFVDIVLEAGLKPYDFCALSVVVTSAGGSFTDWKGQPITMHSDGRILATGSKALHAEILTYTKVIA